MIVTIPYFGALSDRIGRRKVYAIGSIVTGALVVRGVLAAQQFGRQHAAPLARHHRPVRHLLRVGLRARRRRCSAELFDARVRYSGISFVYQFSGIFASGITPIIATALLAQGGGQPWLICAYVMFAAVDQRGLRALDESSGGG